MFKSFWRITKENKTNILISVAIFFLSIVVGYLFIDENNPLIKTLFDELKKIVESIKENDTTTFMIYTIFLNNLLAAIRMIFFGIFFGIFPIIALLTNGIVLGYFLKNSIVPNNLMVFLTGILPHGVIEIPAIIIAAAFGMKLGFSLIKLLAGVFNPEKKRNNIIGLKETIRQIPTVLVGLIVLLFVAAIIESTITGYLLAFIQ